jgi:hypothetical protein
LFWLVLAVPAFGGALSFHECKAGETRQNYVLLIDATKDFAGGQVPVRLLSATDVGDAAALTALDQLLGTCPTVDGGNARLMLKNYTLLANPQYRLQAGAGKTLSVIVFHIGGLGEIQVDEVKRDAKIRSDFGDLLGMILKVREKAAGGSAASTLTIARADYILQDERATVTFSIVPFQETPAPGGGNASQATPKSPITIVTLTTGGPEYFSLSADIPVNSVNQLDYDQTTKKPSLKETPREFMIGIDGYFGDVLTDTYGWFDYHRLGIKGLVRFAKQPLETLGLVLAYRWTSFSVIAGPIWTRNTVKVGTRADGTDILSRRYEQEWRLGIGFDLSVAKSWLTKSSDTKSSGSTTAK